jgi:hypothetical protein
MFKSSKEKEIDYPDKIKELVEEKAKLAKENTALFNKITDLISQNQFYKEEIKLANTRVAEVTKEIDISKIEKYDKLVSLIENSLISIFITPDKSYTVSKPNDTSLELQSLPVAIRYFVANVIELTDLKQLFVDMYTNADATVLNDYFKSIASNIEFITEETERIAELHRSALSSNNVLKHKYDDLLKQQPLFKDLTNDETFFNNSASINEKLNTFNKRIKPDLVNALSVTLQVAIDSIKFTESGDVYINTLQSKG